MADEFTRYLWVVWTETYRLVYGKSGSHSDSVQLANKAVKAFVANFNEFGELKQETK